MPHRTSLFFIGLFFYALFVWFYNTTWFSHPDEVLPLMGCIPVAAWLGMPWQLKNSTTFICSTYALIALLFFIIGFILDSIIFLGGSWCALLYSWQKEHLENESLENAKKSLVFCFMGFPWLNVDFPSLGLWFRHSGVLVTSTLFEIFNYPVSFAKTKIWNNGIDIFVEPACSGINALQSIFIVGTILAYKMFKDVYIYYFNLPVLIFAAWLSNTFRIFLSALFAFTISPSLIQGNFHYILGTLSGIMMFFLCYCIFSMQCQTTEQNQEEQSASQYISFFDIIVLTISAIASSSLIFFWRASPVNNLNFILFILWTIPLFFQGPIIQPSYVFNKVLYITSLLLTLLGVLLSNSTLCYVAFALAVFNLKKDWKNTPILSLLWLITSGFWIPQIHTLNTYFSFHFAFLIKLSLLSCITLATLIKKTTTHETE